MANEKITEEILTDGYIKTNLESILNEYKDLASFFTHNAKIHRVYNGDLLGIMEEEALKFNSAQPRKDNKDMAIAMNYLPKIVDHKSQLYTFEVERTSSNQELVNEYIKLLQIDTHMGNANKFYNASKSVLLELYQNKKNNLQLRPLPNNRFFVWTDDVVEPNKPSAYIKIIDTIKVPGVRGGKPKEVDLLHIYTDGEFMSVTADGKLIQSYKKNKWGVAPFVYVNQEAYSLMPTVSRDTLQNIIQINNIMTNANVCSFYQSHPIRVITGMEPPPNGASLSINPNDYLFLNAREGSTVNPTIDELASTLDVSKSIALAKEILEQTLYINDISAKDAVKSDASGISLQLQDTDIVENRKDQIEQFRPAEEELWEKIGIIHGKMVELKIAGAKTPVGRFNAGFTVEVDFPLPDTNGEIKDANKPSGEPATGVE